MSVDLLRECPANKRFKSFDNYFIYKQDINKLEFKVVLGFLREINCFEQGDN